MKFLSLVLVLPVLASCSVIYTGIIRNNYETPVLIDSQKGVKGDNQADTGGSVQIPIFETESGTCISVKNDGNTIYYSVPAPPKWSHISGNWDVKFQLMVSPEGAFYIGKKGQRRKLIEVASCGT
ncbi:hypothetical protein KUV22_17105 [Microbulbifer agarilyticus]|uniref:hypothetical protein n=1 Tax=Microbulbifer agarilyticus TaxID=260552 RepID=UPI001C95F89E|nr:hypothetical protein [Microbulbifer agarilyticus]MBY6192143.1 hypothetical protein [Microbulbifer agarilyticus]